MNAHALSVQYEGSEDSLDVRGHEKFKARRQTIWTDDRVEILTKLWGDGLSCKRIAAEFGDCTRSAVLGKVLRLQLPEREESRPKPVRRKALDRRPNNFISANAKRPATKETLVEFSFEILSGSNPKPWIDREPNQCAFPVGTSSGADTLSCCEKTDGGRYCAAHRNIMFTKEDTSASPGKNL